MMGEDSRTAEADVRPPRVSRPQPGRPPQRWQDRPWVRRMLAQMQPLPPHDPRRTVG